jgi:predicted DNA-binding transcriptional regulator AlpA
MSAGNGHALTLANLMPEAEPGGANHSAIPPSPPVPAALLWTRRGLARALAVSLATFARMEAAGQIGPKPLRLNRSCVRYRAAECQEWIQQGCLPRAQWQALKATDRHYGKR